MIRIILAFILLAPVSAFGFSTSTEAISPDPAWTFTVDDAGFPAPGETYFDDAFDETVRVITELYPTSNGRKSEYSAQQTINADNTKCFVWNPTAGSYDIADMVNGGIIRDLGESLDSYDRQWHPTDANIFYMLEGDQIQSYSYSDDQYSVVLDLSDEGESGTIDNGGEGDFTNAFTTSDGDGPGTHFVLRTSANELQWYDSVEDVIYSNQPSLSDGNPYMLRDGSGVVVTATPDGDHYFYTVNHTTNAWVGGRSHVSGSSGHSDVIYASDSKNYYVVSGSNTDTIGGSGYGGLNGLVIIDLSDIDVNNLVQVDVGLPGEFHVSCDVITGDGRDWCAVEQYNNNDASEPNVAYEAEIFLVNVLTGAVRRLCHHRSSTFSYTKQPAVSISTDGTLVLFSSDFVTSTGSSEYVDVYSVTTGFSALEPPTNLTIEGVSISKFP